MLRLNLEEFESDFLSRNPEARRADELLSQIRQFLEFVLFSKGVSPIQFTCDDTPGSCNCFRVKSAGVKIGEPIEIVITEGHNPRVQHTLKLTLNLVSHTSVPAPREVCIVGYCERCKKGFKVYPDSSICSKCGNQTWKDGCPDCHKCKEEAKS